MVEVRGAELKTKGGPKLKIKEPKLFFGKFYILKKKNFGPRGGPGPLSPSLGSVPASTRLKQSHVAFNVKLNIYIYI